MKKETHIIEFLGWFVLMLFVAFMFALVIGLGWRMYGNPWCNSTVQIGGEYFLLENGEKARFLTACTN